MNPWRFIACFSASLMLLYYSGRPVATVLSSAFSCWNASPVIFNSICNWLLAFCLATACYKLYFMHLELLGFWTIPYSAFRCPYLLSHQSLAGFWHFAFGVWPWSKTLAWYLQRAACSCKASFVGGNLSRSFWPSSNRSCRAWSTPSCEFGAPYNQLTKSSTSFKESSFPTPASRCGYS